jgi:hypothetical protein
VYKTEGELKITTPATSWYKTPAGSPANQGSYDRITGCDYQQSRGNNTPHFFKRKKDGELLPYTFWEQMVFEGSASGSFDYFLSNGDRSWSTGNWPHLADWNTLSPGSIPALIGESSINEKGKNLVGIAAGAIYSKGWDGLTFFAELHKAIRMFRGVIQRIIKLAATGQIHKIWLEGRYGWRILYYDIRDISNLLQHLDVKRTRFKQRVGVTTTTTNTWTLERVSPYSGNHYFNVTDEVVTSTRGNVIADIQPPKIIFDIPKTLWELTTFSFVIDWVVNVGSWLDALSFLELASKYSAASGFQSIITRDIEYSYTDPASTGSYNHQMAHSSTQTATYTKRVPISVPTTPSLAINLNEFKIIDLISLMFVALQRR